MADLLMNLLSGGMAKRVSQTVPTSMTQGESLEGLTTATLLGNSADAKLEDNIDPFSKNPLYTMFNDQLAELLSSLVQAVPENETLSLALKIHLDLCKVMPGEPIRRWLSSIRGYSQLLESRTPENEAKFLAAYPTMEYICELEITAYWDDFDDEAKDNLWQHLGNLDKVAHSLGQFKAPLMQRMESKAESLSYLMADDAPIGDISAQVLDDVINDGDILKLIGVDPEVAQSPQVRSMAKTVLSSLGNLKF